LAQPVQIQAHLPLVYSPVREEEEEQERYDQVPELMFDNKDFVKNLNNHHQKIVSSSKVVISK